MLTSMANIATHAINTELVDAIKAEATRLTVLPAEDDRPKAQGFPVHALPEGLRWIVEHLHATIGFPMDYTGAAILFTLSVAIGTSARITPKRGWTEAAILWLALVGRPGANKTHPLTMMLRPLNKRDLESARQYENELKEWEAAMKQARKDEAAPKPIEPECAQHLVSDTTPEALVEALARNPRGVGLHRDELAGWVEDFGRYNKGGDVQAYLSIWSAQPVRVNRVKSKRPRFVERPFVAVCGTIQPGVLGRLVADGRGANGFVDRILFAFPEAQEVPAWNESEPDAQCADYWQALVERLLNIPPPDEGAEPADAADMRLLDEERRDVLGQLLNTIGERCRKILELWKLSYSMEEIAEQLGFSSADMARKAKYRCHVSLLEQVKNNPKWGDMLR